MTNIIFNSGNINGTINQVGGNERPEHERLEHERPEHVRWAEERSSSGSPMQKEERTYQYDVAISYASEQEQYVSRVYKILKMERISVFFAPNREEEFLGRDMITEFYEIYRYKSRYVACFISEEYLKKDITMHEAKTDLLRQKEEKRNCLIPVCWGTARLDGLDPDIHYLNGDRLREVEIAEKIKMIVNRSY